MSDLKKKYSKQGIIMRSDLRNEHGHKVRTGKLISQGAHASLAALLKLQMPTTSGNDLCVLNTTNPAVSDWINGLFTKITLVVNSEAALVDIYERAISAGITAALIEDSGLTEFGGVKTKTAVALGPDWSTKIDPITTGLSLL